MCGLFGSKTIAGANNALTQSQVIAKAKIVEGLAMAMQDRGKDSTGIAALFNKEYRIYKDTQVAQKFVTDKTFTKIIRDNPAVVIGHTRHATTGAVTPRNAHPFKRGKIIGAHNGMVSNYLEFKKNGNMEVDSEAIFYLLKKYKNNYTKAFRKLSGSFALTWSNLREKDTLYIARDGNPLFMVYSPELKTIFWCSHQYPLIALVHTIAGNKLQELIVKDEMAYRFDKDLEFTKKEVEFKTQTYAQSYSYNYGNGNYYSRPTINRVKPKTSVSVKTTTKTTPKTSNDAFSRKWEDIDDVKDTGKEPYDHYEDEYDFYGIRLPSDIRDEVKDEDTLDFIKEIAWKEGCYSCAEIICDEVCYFCDESSMVLCEECATEMLANGNTDMKVAYLFTKTRGEQKALALKPA